MIRIAVVEDETLYQSQIQRYLLRYQQQHAQKFDVTIFNSGSSFWMDYRPQYDVILMDIQMPGMSGMETAKAIRKIDQHVAIAFITSMANYAVQSYEVEAIDFIVKPFTYEVFEFKLDRIISRTEQSRTEAFIMLTSNDGIRKVFLAELCYVEVMHHTLVYHTTHEDITLRSSMREAEKQLAMQGFTKCGQSYLVNLRFVTRIEADTVYLGDSVCLHISRGSKKELVRAMSDYMATI